MAKNPKPKKPAAEPRVPGFHMPVPGHNELRPNARSANPVEPGAEVRRFAQNKQSIMDFGAPRPGYYGDPTSPASPTFVAPGPPTPTKDSDSDCLQTPTLIKR
jgi:hypothetical protein